MNNFYYKRCYKHFKKYRKVEEPIEKERDYKRPIEE